MTGRRKHRPSRPAVARSPSRGARSGTRLPPPAWCLPSPPRTRTAPRSPPTTRAATRGGHGSTSAPWSAAFAFYLAGLAALCRGGPALAAVLVIAVLIQLAPLVGPVLLSTDVYTYWAYARTRGRSRREPLRRAPSRASRTTPPTRAWAPTGATRRRCTARGSRWPRRASQLWSAHRPSTPLRGSTGSSPPQRCSCSTSLAAALLAPAFAAAPSSAGTRSSRSTSPAAATTTRWMMALVLGAIAARGVRDDAQLAGAAWAAAIAVKWVPAHVPCRSGWSRRRVTRRSVRHLGFAVSAAVVDRAVGLALRRRVARGGRAARREPREAGCVRDPASAVRARDLRGRGARSCSASSSSSRSSGSLREARRGRARLALSAGAAPRRDAVARALVRGLGGAARRLRSKRTARRELLALVLSAYLLRDAVPL